MKITIDTDKKYIIVPDKFFAKIEELNAFRRENGVPEVKPMDYIDKMFGDTEIILNGGTAAEHNEAERAVKQGLSLPAVKKLVDREVEKHDAKILEALSEI